MYYAFAYKIPLEQEVGASSIKQGSCHSSFHVLSTALPPVKEKYGCTSLY